MKLEVVDRYVYAVVSKLPGKQRDDIEKEIRSLIEDMMVKYEDEPTIEKQAQKALEELGDPNLLADNYMERKRYLIGPDNFHNYVFVLKIVAFAVFIGVSIGYVVDELFIQNNAIPYIAANYIGTVFSALFQAFAWVTIIFAISEYYGVNLSKTFNQGSSWSIKDLKPIPNKKSLIRPSEAIFGMVFGSIFYMILAFSPQVLAAYILDANNHYITIPFFNTVAIGEYKSIIIILFIVSIAKEVAKLIYGRWNLRLSVIYSIFAIISSVLFCIIALDQSIYNQNFLTDLSKLADINTTNIVGFPKIAAGIVLVTIVITIIDVATAFYKGYSAKK